MSNNEERFQNIIQIIENHRNAHQNQRKRVTKITNCFLACSDCTMQNSRSNSGTTVKFCPDLVICQTG